jgi:hypothetical protein
VHSQKRARVLYVKEALLEAGQLVKRRKVLELENEVLGDPIRIEEVVLNILVAPLIE